MSQEIQFTSNYTDHSTDRGFQFEFTCDRCGTGYRTPFKPSVTGTISGVIDTASSLFGGIFGQASNLSERVHSSAWQKTHDDAFSNAILEVKPNFMHCPRCQSWVCRKSCWNTRRGLCKNCAPDLAVEMSAAQASKAVEEVWSGATTADEEKVDTKEWKEVVRATCPQCEAPLAANAKFCPNCGAKLASQSFCKECGTKLQPEAKFCADCGTKVS
jgi:DNA-directed RNA polymerase subunit M/transcription elongation factor TFIIS